MKHAYSRKKEYHCHDYIKKYGFYCFEALLRNAGVYMIIYGKNSTPYSRYLNLDQLSHIEVG